jgi:hypothetical protein
MKTLSSYFSILLMTMTVIVSAGLGAGVPIGTVNAQSPAPDSGGPWKDLGNLGPGPLNHPVGVYRNNAGVYIPWNVICNSGQQFLLQSCSDLIDPSTGLLTDAGVKAADCINNGLALGTIGHMFNISPDLERTILGGLASFTGCDNIVDMNKVPASQVDQLLGSVLAQNQGTSTSGSSASQSLPNEANATKG